MTNGEPETVVSASLQKIKSIKNPFFIFLNLIKSETSDSFVNHFDGHFAYLKTLDFYFKEGISERSEAAREWRIIALFMSASVPQAYRFHPSKQYGRNMLKLLL